MLKLFTLLALIGLISGVSFAQDTTRINTFEYSLNDNTPVFVTTLEDIDENNGGGNISGLLQSSRDVFASAAGFNFFAARFRIRGYNNDKTTIFLNGVPTGDAITGWSEYYKWGGLNDLTRYAETKNWLTANPYHFGGIGGYSNIDVSATSIRKGFRFSYANTNRAYRHRLMGSWGTGMQKNGWAFSASFSTRYAQEGYVEGTFYEAFSYYLAAKKKINENHSLNLSIMGAPRRRGRSNIFVQEVYDLTGNNYHNTNWGWQTLASGDSIKRNANIAKEHVPVIVLNHDWKIDEKTTLKTSVLTTFGKRGRERLNWYNAQDPRPDYYRYLPSYHESRNDPANAALWRDRWVSGNTDFTQINWERLYRANDNNLYSLEDADGEVGNTVVGKRSKYIMENQWSNELSFSGASVLNKTIEKMQITAGVYYQMQRNHIFKTISDLLGGDFWVDVDQFAEQDYIDPNAAQNNLENPNRTVGVGDIFGWDYYIHNHEATAFGQAQWKLDKIDLYAAVEISDQFFWREGVYQNGRFPDNSKGKSEVYNFFNYAAKGGITYKVSGRQFITANGAFLTEAPTSRSVFISPRTRDFTVDNPVNETIYSADINYILSYPKLKMRMTYYYMERKDALWTRSFYHDEYRSFVNYVMEGVDYFHQGIEFGVDGKVVGGLSASGVFAWGQHLYNSRPTATVYRDNSAELIDEDKLIYLRNYKIGGMPQSAASVGLKYSGKGYWFAAANFNYFMDIYLDPSPDRRTAEAIEGFYVSDPQWNEALDQTRLDNGYTLNIMGGKSFKIGDYFLSLFANVSNITNNTNFVNWGFEQLRYDKTNLSKFPPRIAYMFGLNYFVMATLRF
ncbi:MAG: Plug domain-containing protein [Crocinitomicaceae bacterium]